MNYLYKIECVLIELRVLLYIIVISCESFVKRLKKFVMLFIGNAFVEHVRGDKCLCILKPVNSSFHFLQSKQTLIRRLSI